MTKNRRKQLILSLLNKNIHENDKNAINFRRSNKQGEDVEYIARLTRLRA